MAEQQFHGCDEMAPRCSKVNSFREAPRLHLPEAAELEFLHRAAWRSVVVPPLIDQGMGRKWVRLGSLERYLEQEIRQEALTLRSFQVVKSPVETGHCSSSDYLRQLAA